MVKRMVVGLVALLMVAFLMEGCTTVTNGDGQVAYQSEGAAQSIVASAEIAKEAVKAGNPDAANAALDSILAAAGDIAENEKATLEAWGGTQEFKDLKPYAAAASMEARAKQKDEHKAPWYIAMWGSVWSWLLTGAGVMATVLKIASSIPVVGNFLGGPLGQAAGDLLKRLVSLHSTASAAPDGKVHMNDLKAQLDEMRRDPKLKPYIDKALHTAHLDSLIEPVDVPAAPAATAAAPAI